MSPFRRLQEIVFARRAGGDATKVEPIREDARSECLTEGGVLALLEGKLDSLAAQAAATHLDTCDACRALTAAVLQAFTRSQSENTTGLSEHLDPQDVAKGSVFGRYVVLDLLGSGGMGRVYRAYDPTLDRNVALKVATIRDLQSSRETVNQLRLLAEARAAARITHPNVVGIHDVGTLNGRVFVAMELVEGVTLRGWLSEPRSWREIVAKFVEAGRGLAEAHRAGFVHRDFKPENVLIGRDGRARVTDFGLAKLTRLTEHAESPLSTPDHEESHELTRHDVCVGTPAYMAPEQRNRQRITAQADQYSFCIALWEGLHGERPGTDTLRSSDTRPVLHRTERFRTPRRVRAILRRGLRENPADRFASMDELLADLQRASSGFVQRHRAALGSLGSIGVLVGVAALVWLKQDPCSPDGFQHELLSVWGPTVRQGLETSLNTSDLHRTVNSPKLFESMDLLREHWMRQRMDACRATKVHHNQSEEVLQLRIACMDRRKNEFTSLVDALRTPSPEVLDHALEAVQSIQLRMGSCADTNLLTSIVPLPDDPKQMMQVAELRRQLSDITVQYDTAEYDKGRKNCEALLLRANALDYAPLLAELDLLCASFEAKAGQSDGARKTLHRAISHAMKGRHDEIVAKAWLALVPLEDDGKGSLSRAHDTLLLADGAIQRLGHPALLEAVLLSHRGDLLSNEGQLPSAQEAFQQALELRAKNLPKDSLAVADSHNRLGLVFRKLGNYPSALSHFEQAEQILLNTVGDRHDSTATNRMNLATVLTLLGRFDQALEKLERVRTTFEQTLGASHPRLCSLVNNIAYVHWLQQGDDVALNAYRDALSVCRATLGEEHRNTAKTRFNLAFVHLRKSQPDLALPLLDKAIEVHRVSPGESSPTFADDLLALGVALLQKNDRTKAVAHLERAVGIYERNKVDPSDLGLGQAYLARALHACNYDSPRVAQLLTRARRALENAGPSRRRDLAELEAWMKQAKLQGETPPSR